MTTIDQLHGIGMGFAARPAKTYFDQQNHQEVFANYRAQKYELNKVARHNQPDPTPWTADDEKKLVDKLWIEWFGEPYSTHSNWGHPSLNLDALPSQPVRRGLRPFKIQYETYYEAKLRLGSTVIGIKGNPFYISKVGKSAGGWLLAVSDAEKTYQVEYNDIQDLRSIPAMYIPGEYTGWVCRQPGKVYQQGLNRHNTHIKSVDGGQAVYQFDANAFLRAWRMRADRTWNEAYASVMEEGSINTLRLSDEVAVRHIASTGTIACYRGRQLGKVKGNDIIVDDEDDLLQGWIEASVKRVGFEMRG